MIRQPAGWRRRNCWWTGAQRDHQAHEKAAHVKLRSIHTHRFSSSVTDSQWRAILTSCIPVWCSNSTTADLQVLQHVVKEPINLLHRTYMTRWLGRAINITSGVSVHLLSVFVYIRLPKVPLTLNGSVRNSDAWHVSSFRCFKKEHFLNDPDQMGSCETRDSKRLKAIG